ncbi:MAG: dockerin type I domain-containing protein [Planctomycetota bacterium]
MISKVTENVSGTWSGDTHVEIIDWALFHRSDDVVGGAANPDLGGDIGGSAASISLNPAPLSVEVVTGGGGTQTIVYPAGTLAFVSDAVGSPIIDGVRQPQIAKKLYSYDLRKIDTATSVEPDYDTASSGPPELGGIVFGAFGNADWNDVFRPVLSNTDIQNQTGSSSNSTGFGREFAWSSDGQRIYAVAASSSHGGIYRIDPTRNANDVTGVVRVWADNDSDTNQPRIFTEPGVISTSVRNFAPGTFGSGDQILVEGSFSGGNAGGINVFFDDRSTDQLAAPVPLFTEQEFRSFADYYSNGPNATGTQVDSVPRYFAVAGDDEGNVYFYETQTDGLFRYDTQGRFVKLASEREQDLFQLSRGSGTASDEIGSLRIRTSNEPGFSVPEVLYADNELDAPVGVLAYLPGDFDRDNDLDADDLDLFSAAIGLRNTAADDEFVRFDLNGNEVASLVFDENNDPVLNSLGEQRISHTNNQGVVVDWKDVKILQQFAEFPNGDTNFDGALDLTDLQTMAANYFTEPGQAAETWIDGDFASVDPDYLFTAPDANLVNEVDLAVIADAWLNDLGQPAPDEATLNGLFSGQFLADVVAAFSGGPGLPGDANGDGNVDLLDLDILGQNFGLMPATLAQGDFNGDGKVDLLDLDILGQNFGMSAAVAVPEPSTLAIFSMLVASCASCRRRR